MQSIFVLLLYGLLFVGVFFFVDAISGIIRAARGRDEEAVERRLTSSVLTTVHMAAPRYDIVRRQETTAEWLLQLPFITQFQRLLATSGTGLTVQRAAGIMVVLSVVFLLLYAVIVPARFLPIAIIAAPASGVGLVILFVLRARNQRRHKFEEQLPDAIDLIVRSLKVGHPLSGAMAVVGRELPAPISTEFQTAFDAVSYGQDIPTAFIKMAERVPLPDLGYLSMAIQIQQESGGNLVESLAKLSTVIRERFRMFRKVKALTAEGRFSAWFLSMFPFVLIPIITFIKPDYYTSVMDIPVFNTLVMVTIVLLIINIIAMRVITNLKV
jgi:tight adherence protein B